jgi:hypothetical protein
MSNCEWCDSDGVNQIDGRPKDWTNYFERHPDLQPPENMFGHGMESVNGLGVAPCRNTEEERAKIQWHFSTY